MEITDNYEHIDNSIKYIIESIPTKDTEEYINIQFAEGCQCTINCSVNGKCECLLRYGQNYEIANENLEHWNDISLKYTLIDTKFSQPIYECNANCKCYGQLCGNRLVQYGPSKHLQITNLFSNTNIDLKTGFGLKTTKNLKKNSFVCEYAGEVISKTEAQKRFNINENKNLMNYILCVKEHFGKKSIITFIDPSEFGNIGRYVNHSCEPNCALLPVRINGPIPKICIFTIDNIQSNTELKYDYGDGNLGFISVDDNIQNKSKLIACLCGSKKCRKWLPYANDLFDKNE